MKHEDMAKWFFDYELRIEDMIWLSGCAAAASESLESFAEDEPDEFERLLGANPNAGGVEVALSSVREKGCHGYLVKAATPIREDGIYSWGHYTTHWFYFEHWDETFVVKALRAWAEKAGVAK